MKTKFHFPKCLGAGRNSANANLTLSCPAGSLSLPTPPASSPHAPARAQDPGTLPCPKSASVSSPHSAFCQHSPAWQMPSVITGQWGSPPAPQHLGITQAPALKPLLCDQLSQGHQHSPRDRAQPWGGDLSPITQTLRGTTLTLRNQG